MHSVASPVLAADPQVVDEDDDHVARRADLGELGVRLLVDDGRLERRERLEGVGQLPQHPAEQVPHQRLLDLGQGPVQAGPAPGPPSSRSTAVITTGSGRWKIDAPASGGSDRMARYVGLGTSRMYSS